MVAGVDPRPSGNPDAAPPVLLSYQQDLLADASQFSVVVYEKSRRIGVSWATAAEAATLSSSDRSDGGMDTLYIGYNLDMAREFIGDCAFWLRHIHGFAAEVGEFLFQDGDDDGKREIKAFRIDLPSGHSIVALTSRPRSLRGRQGFVVIDEAAFHDDLAGLIKAALALLMWGGRVWIISTHLGDDNPFAELVKDVRSGRKPYKLLTTTFDDAVRQGLYKRICLRTGKPWSAEAETKWVQEIRDFYGDDAAEELDCVPAQGSGVWLSRAVIDACMKPEHDVVYWRCEKGFELKADEERKAAARTWYEGNITPRLARLLPGLRSFLGGDVGRSGDLSVFWPGQLDGAKLRVPFTVELRNVPFAEQQYILFRLLDEMPSLTNAALDARGIGAMLSELAMQKFGASRIVEVKASVEWYRVNMPPFKARFEDQTIEIPLDDDTRADLRQVRLDKGVAKVPEGLRIRSIRGGERHGDSAIAGALLNFAASSPLQPAAGADVLATEDTYRPEAFDRRRRPPSLFERLAGPGSLRRRA